MKRKIISLILCLVLLTSMLPSAYAQVLEDMNIADSGSLPAALCANDRDAVLKALAGDLHGNGVIVDLNTFNAVVITPASKFEDMYGNMPEPENRVVIGFYENEKADAASAIEKETRSFYFSPPEDAYKSGCTFAMSADLRNLKLPERKEQELDPLLDKVLNVRERGFYDVNGNVCSACAAYTQNPAEHSVLPCTVHMTCQYDKNDIAHYSRCRECGRMSCACYCNNMLSARTCIAVTGSGEYAVGGSFHEKLILSFDKDASVEYVGLEEEPMIPLDTVLNDAALWLKAQANDIAAFNAEKAARKSGGTVTAASVETVVPEPEESVGPEAAESSAVPEELPAYRPKTDVNPYVECVVCGKTISVPQGVPFKCGTHYACPECADKLTADERSTHDDVLECGHYACDGKKHSTEIFSENCTLNPKHHKCEGEDGIHHCPSCDEDYPCDEAPLHSACYVCGRSMCIGEHIDCEYCGGRWCDGRYHGPGSCV